MTRLSEAAVAKIGRFEIFRPLFGFLGMSRQFGVRCCFSKLYSHDSNLWADACIFHSYGERLNDCGGAMAEAVLMGNTFGSAPDCSPREHFSALDDVIMFTVEPLVCRAGSRFWLTSQAEFVGGIPWCPFCSFRSYFAWRPKLERLFVFRTDQYPVILCMMDVSSRLMNIALRSGSI